MHFSLLTTLSLASSAVAQSSSDFSSATTASKAATKTGSSATTKSTGTSSNTKHVVMVGADGLTFTPSVISAAIGHSIEFMFHPQNHSVVQAAFDSPCTPMEQSASMKGMAGFYSGFMPVNGTSTTTGMKSFTVKVNSTDTMWFYCSQGKHCQEGMVGVINPTNGSGQTVAAFASACKGASANLSPAKVQGGTVANVNVAAAAAVETVASTTVKAGTKATGKNTAKSATMRVASSTRPGGAGQATAAAASAAGSSGTGITQSNGSGAPFGELAWTSSLGLLGLVAGGVIVFA